MAVERRFETGMRAEDSDKPGLIQKDDNTVWLVNPDGSETQITGGGGGAGGNPSGPAGGSLAGTYPSPSIAANAIGAAELANNAVDTAALQDGAVTGAKILDGTITDADVADANKDGAAGTVSLRTLGTGALQATAGNDSRLSDARIPTDGSVTTAKLANGAVTAAKVAADVATQAELDAQSSFLTVPNITGSRGANAALASLLTSLATIGLITDGSS